MTAKNKENAESKVITENPEIAETVEETAAETPKNAADVSGGEAMPEAANLTPEAQKILGIAQAEETPKAKTPDMFSDAAVWTAEKKDCGKVWLNGRQVREMLTFSEKNSGKKKFVHNDMTIAFVKFCKDKN